MKIKFRYGYDGSLPVITECDVDYGNRRLVGVAKCNLKYDFPNKSIGRKVAFKKAISVLPKDQRKDLWNEFLSKFKV